MWHVLDLWPKDKQKIAYFCSILLKKTTFNVAIRYSVYMCIYESYNLEVMSDLWHWSQRSHNCFPAYLSTFSRSISSLFNLWISRTKFNYIWPGQISFMSETANLLEHINSFVCDIHSMYILCYTEFPVLYLLWVSMYACTNFHYWWVGGFLQVLRFPPQI